MSSVLQRETSESGLLIPVVGDKVYQSVRGPFGTSAAIYGEVIKNRSGIRVKATGSSSIVGAAAKQRTYPLTPHWIVSGDPEIRRRKDAALAAEQVRQAEHAAELAEKEAAAMNLALERGTLDPSGVGPGDILESPERELYLVEETMESTSEKFPDKMLFASLLDDPESHAGSLGSDLRGWRKVRHQLPAEGRFFIRLGDGQRRQWIGGAWVPVEWNEEAAEYRPLSKQI